MTHKHYQLAYHAYVHMSHVPDKRAASVCKMYDDHQAELAALGADMARYETLFTDWLRAHGRCASAMIVGPARFPVDRNRKAMVAAHKKWEALANFLRRARSPRPPKKELDYGIEAGVRMFADIKVVQNTEANRLQIIFPAKPVPAMIETLKRNGYKWSPKNTAWQRQLTPNALKTISWIFGEYGFSGA